MHMPSVALGARVLGLAAVVTTIACGEDKHPVGGTCTSDGDCASDLCASNVCLDPSLDDDLDGLVNAIEDVLGSDPNDPDSDDDGIGDADEVSADDQSAIDTDGDGDIDIGESAVEDADGDCIPDQYDADDAVPSSDLSPMIDVVCRDAGPCAEQRALLVVSCATGTATCVYDRVQGYADPEARCDGVDENCDGATDEAFPDGCGAVDFDGDGVLDAVDVCPETPDAGQADGDADGVGDACAGDYVLVFAPAPPSEVVAGEAFEVSAALARKTPLPEGVDPATRPALPRFAGEVRLGLASGPAGVGEALATVRALDGVVVFLAVELTRAGVVELELASALGKTVSGPLTVVPADVARVALSAPAEVAAGAPFAVRAEAFDTFDNAAPLDAAATLSASDTQAEIPAGGAFVDGVFALDGVVLGTLGATTLTLEVGLIAATAEVEVGPGVAAAFRLELPARVIAGEAVPFTITAVDAFDNPTSFVGTASLQDDDLLGGVPPQLTFAAADGGTKTRDVTFGGRGARVVRANAGATIRGEARTEVRPGRASAVTLLGVQAVNVGAPQVVRVGIVDRYGQTADDPEAPFTGTVTFAVVGATPDAPPPEPAPVLPGPVTFTAAMAGLREVTVTWLALGDWTLVASSDGLDDGELDVGVSGGTATRLRVTLPSGAKAGDEVDAVITALDAGGTPAIGYTGVVTLVTSDARATVPATVTFASADRGTRTVKATFVTAGSTTVDAKAGALAGAGSITVRAAAPAALALVVDTAATIAGRPRDVAVEIHDRFGNVASDPADPYLGTVAFEASPPAVPAHVVPAPITFVASDAGRRTVAITWRFAGTYRLTATGTALATPSDAHDFIVTAAPAVALELALATSVKAAVATPLTIRAVDDAGNADPSYVGRVALTLTDPAATAPAFVDFAASHRGVRTVNVTFATPGARLVSADDGALTGEIATSVLPGAPHHLALAFAAAGAGPVVAGQPVDVRVSARDVYGNLASDPATLYLGTVSFSLAGAAPTPPPTLPAPSAFVAADAGVRTVATTWFRPGTFTLRASGTSLLSAPATLEVVVQAGAVSRFVVSAPDSAQVGVPFDVTVSAVDASDNVVTSFVGAVALASDDPLGTAPALTFAAANAGVVTAQVELATLGARTLTATQGALTGSDAVTVRPGPPAALRVTPASSDALTGEDVPLALAVVDARGNLLSDPAAPYLGTVTFALVGDEPDLEPDLPSATFTAADAGDRAAALTFYRPGPYTVRASASGVATPVDIDVDIAVGPATRFTFDVDTPVTLAADQEATIRVLATDAWGNVDEGYDSSADVTSTSFGVTDGIGFTNGESDIALTPPNVGDYTLTVISNGADGLEDTLAFAVVSYDPQALAFTLTPETAFANVAFGGVTVALRDGDNGPALAPEDITVALELYHMAPGPAAFTPATRTIFMGQSSATFDGLVIPRDGRFTFRATSPSDLTAAISSSVAVRYRAPTVTITDVVNDGGCVTATYDIAQPDGQPVDIEALYQVGADVRVATQAASVAPIEGTTRVRPGTGHTFMWSAGGDLPFPGYATGGAAPLTLTARAGTPLIARLPGSDGIEVPLDGVPFALEPGGFEASEEHRDIAVADIDADGVADVAVITDEDVLVAASTAGALSTIPIAAGDFARLALGDRDYDGVFEAIVIARGPGDVIVLDLDALEETSRFTPCSGGAATEVAIGQVDRAGNRDVVVLCNSGVGYALEVWNDDAGDWQRAASFTQPQNASALTIGDADHDGLVDLFVARGDHVDVYRAAWADPGPHVAHTLAQSLSVPSPIAAITLFENDQIADGFDELMVATDEALYQIDGERTPAGLFDDIEDALTWLPGADALAAGDFDHDGIDDLAVQLPALSRVYLSHWWTGGPALLDPLAYTQPLTRLAAGDGALALLDADPDDQTAFVRLEVGREPRCQRHVAAIQAAPPWRHKQALVADDFDGDGKTDMAGDADGGGFSVVRGRGDGSFDADVFTKAFSATVTAIRSGDIDRDGDRDIVVVADDEVREYRNDTVGGVLAFTLFASFTVRSAAEPSPLAVDDLDGDGYADLVYIDASDQLVRRYNLGAGDDIDLVSDPGSRVFALEIGNTDDRGALDLVFHGKPDAGAERVCSMRADADTGLRAYLAPACATVGGSLSNLRLEASLDPDRRVFYVDEPGGPTTLAARVVGPFVDAPGDVVSLGACGDDGVVTSFTLGFFDADDGSADVAYRCIEGGQTRFGWVRNSGGDLGTPDESAYTLDASPFVAADFDGDREAELGFELGTRELYPMAFGPDGAFTSLPEPAAAAGGELDGDERAEVFVLRFRYDPDISGMKLDLAVNRPVADELIEETTICTDCSSSGWTARAATGDVDGDGRPDVVALLGNPDAQTRLGIFSVGVDDIEVQPEPFDPAELFFDAGFVAVGALLPAESGAADILVGGESSPFNGHFLLAHRAPDGSVELYRETDGANIPTAPKAAFIAELVPDHDGPEIGLVSEDGELHLYGPVACDLASDCLAPLGAPVDVADTAGFPMRVAGAAVVRGANGLNDVVVQLGYDADTSHSEVLSRLAWSVSDGAFVPTTLASYGYADLACDDETSDESCVYPGLPPLVVDWDGDGADDVLAGWRYGQVWELFAASGGRRFVGSTFGVLGAAAFILPGDRYDPARIHIIDRDGQAIGALISQRYWPMH